MATQIDKIVFTGAGERGYAGRGRHFLVKTVTGLVTLIFKQPNRGADMVLKDVGIVEVGPVDEAWERVEIVSGSAGTFEFVNGDDPVRFPNAVNISGGNVSKASAGAQGNVGITNGANGVQIRAANTARRVLHVFNNALAGGDVIYAGYGAALVATDGVPIPPQAERSFGATDQVRAIALVAGPVNVRWIEELD